VSARQFSSAASATAVSEIITTPPSVFLGATEPLRQRSFFGRALRVEEPIQEGEILSFQPPGSPPFQPLVRPLCCLPPYTPRRAGRGVQPLPYGRLSTLPFMAVQELEVEKARAGRKPRGVSPPSPSARQDLALNLSAKRRLCNTVGGRGIEGITRCCAISIARSRAAATTNLVRPNQSWVLRAFFARVTSCALIKVFMICPYGG
jgi:hypothetical protein